jgi:hypothetical protein
MVAFFKSDPRIGAVTAKVVFDWGKVHACAIDVIEPAGLHDGGTEITEPVGRRTLHSRVRRPREGDCSRCERLAEVDGGIGCCLMYNRAEALAAGGYDPGFAPVWFDDLDLTIRLRARGLKVFCLPDVRVVHHAGGRPGLGRRAGSMLPARVRDPLVNRLGIDRPSADHGARLDHHYRYWREKWGFDLLNPDMTAVRARWGGTEVCWRDDPSMRAAGERIAAGFAARSGQDG